MIVVAVFGSSTTDPGSPEWAEAEWLGETIASHGWDVATGGYGGTMEAVSAGASRAGGRVIGVTAPAVFPSRAGANPYVTHEITESTITRRIARLIELSDAAIALPGSIGTLAELVVAWNVAFLAPISGQPDYPVVAIGPDWRDVITAIDLRLSSGRGLVTVTDSAEEAFAAVHSRIPRNRQTSE